MKTSTWLSRVLSRILTITLIAMMTIQIAPPVKATIVAGDHFTLTVADDATSMDSGGTLVFTAKSYNSLNEAKALTGSDKACVEINNPSTFSPSTYVDVTAVGAGLTVTNVGSGSNPHQGGSGMYPTESSDISGSNNNLVCFNMAVGDSDTNTFTVRATSNFGIYVYTNGVTINDNSETYPGKDFAMITVNSASGGADHLVANIAASTAETNAEIPVTITQVNAGGGIVSSALTDVMVTLLSSIPSSAESNVITSSSEHGLSVNDFIKFSFAANNTSATYLVSTVSSPTTFKVIGPTNNFIAGGFTKLTPSSTSSGASNSMHATTPGTISSNTASTISMQATGNITVPGGVAIQGCTDAKYIASSKTADSISVIGPTACTPTPGGNITSLTLTPGTESSYTLNGSSAYIYSINGTPTGNTTTTYAADQSLTNGVLNVVIKASEAETILVSASSDTLASDETDVNDSVIISSASSLTIKGYGPPNNQNGVPTNAPIDIMFNRSPSSESITFPLTNTADSAISISSGGVPTTGVWEVFAENYGDFSFYRTKFTPTSGMLTASTVYTVSILKSFVSTLELPEGSTSLTDAGSSYTFAITTGTGGGDFTQPQDGGNAPGGMGGGFTGTFGGSVPPMANLGYPRPGSWDVPTNISKISIDFDRQMDATTFTNTNIYLKKIVNGVEVDPIVTTTVSPTTGTSQNASLAITGTLAANSEYRVVVTRNVKDPKGTQLAGMPLDDDGNPLQSFGFGFNNMGSFKENFRTGSGTSTITASLMGSNLDKYNSSGTITGVPTSIIPRASFNGPLDPSTVNSTNVTLRKGSSPVTGTVNYKGESNVIEFATSTTLLANTIYTFNVSTSVTSVTGAAISEVTKTFTTGSEDITAPQLVFSEADNYGFRVKFDEAMDQSLAENKAYYTLKTCSGSAVSPDGSSCTGEGSVTTVSLMTGVNAHYDTFENSVWFDGLTLTANDGFYIAINSSVKDAAGNAINSSYDTFNGMIMGADKFAGGQGMQTMGGLGMQDFNMGTMGMTPISAMPMNSMASATTKFFIRFPVATQIPTGGWVELTFPAGFTVTGVKQDAQSPMKTDFNGPATGTPTFATNLTSITPTPTDGAGAQANDGVGYIAAANKVYVKLSGATSASDFIQIDLDGITNASEPKDSSSSGYSLQIKTFNSSGALLEGMTTMPFFISSSGTGSIGGRITASSTGINGVTVYIGSPFTGPMETTTANNANGGGEDGEYKFSNLPSGQYMIFTQPNFTVGETTYNGKSNPEPITVSGTTVKNISITASNGTTGATQPITISYTSESLAAITSLGFNDSIDVFANSPKGFVSQTIARASLTGTSKTVNLYLPTAGDWMVGIGPAMPKGPMAGTPSQMNWIPGPSRNVMITQSDIGGASKSAIPFTMSIADKAITGKVLDASGTAISNAEIYAYNPKGGTGSHTTSATDGTFTLNVTEGTYKVGAFLPGMPNSGEIAILVSGSSFYVDGSPTASTGSSGDNPFNLKINKSNSALTIQGRVTDGTNAISNSAVWSHRTDSPAPPIHSKTDNTGNYTLYVSAGTWMVEADAPGYGYMGSKTLTVTTSNLANQDFTVANDQGSISGTINIPGTSDDSGVIVTAYCTDGTNETTTAADGTYTMNVPDGTCTVRANIPGTGELAPQTVAVDGTETGKDFAVATPQTFTITLNEAVSEDTEINLFNATGQGNEIIIPAGSTSASVTVPEGTYYLDTDIPGIPLSDVETTGAEFNNVNGTPGENNEINIDGTGDSIVLTLPTIYSVSGQITSSSTGINDVTISIYNTTSKETFAVTTSNDAAGGGLDGEYLIKLPAGTYSISADKSGYSSTPIDVTVADTSTGNNIALTVNSRTIAGTVLAGGVAAADTKVYAEASGGGFASTTTSTDGTYILSVKPGIWTINAKLDGYAEGTALQVDVTAANETGKNFSLTALTGADIPSAPQSETVVPSTGGIISDTGTNTEILVPPNALGSGTDAGQVTTKEISDVFETPTAIPIGYGQEISASDANGNPITTLDNEVTFSLYLTADELIAAGLDTPAEADQLTVGYWDDGANNWVPQSSTKEYYDASGNIIPYTTVEAAGTLLAANVDYVYLVAETDHFTTFAPILPTGPTPPATPATPTATAGSGQVTLTWTKNSEADMSSYNIWEANVSEGVATTLLQSACGTTTCTKTITGLTNGTTYSYQIIAVDTDGNESAGSTAASVTPAASVTGGGAIIQLALTPETPKSTNETTITPSIKSITDIAGHWAKTFIEDLFAKKVISGTDATHYSPNKPITRAEFTKIAINMFNIQVNNSLMTTSFKDVKTSDWFAPYVEAAYGKQIIAGYENNLFKPNQPINRAEAVKILFDAAKIKVDEIVFSAKFPDVKNTDWYAKYVEYAANNKIVNGYENGMFNPSNNITRAEAAKIASLLLGLTVQAK
ncbi:MAG: fibronectin type III domain-containing protein [Candidatus Peregrinibacteria bacterium GW2011_GWF2_38_29]|nr:MAG: fibronectin type III domain-containing protein [Candidatus Peregrinibacteria bacterium GW2011_GWF2_38_29]HBB03216.1 hypothetical protein [Candidatus Peregrinibacteria bacterium]